MRRVFPKVTIGLCVKNCEETIQQCMESVVNQDYPHESMEIIVVDGCSKDKTLLFIEEILMKKDIKSKILFENEGLGKARQMVIEQSDGEYVVWVDGDMVIPESYVRRHVDFMENNPKAGIATGRRETLPNNNLASKLESVARNVSIVKWKKMNDPETVGTAGAIHRVRAVKQIGGFNINIKSGEDREISYRVKLAGWSLCSNSQNIFYEKLKYDWKLLFKKYFWYGYGWRSLLHMKVNKRVLIQRLPLIGFIDGSMLSIIAYKMTGQKWVFLLPLHFIFIWTAWYCGLITAYIKYLLNKGKL